MLHWSAVINGKVKRACDARGEACRAYQAAALFRIYYLAGRRISTLDILCADIVVEAIHKHLRRDGRIDWTARTAVLDMLEGATDRAAAEKFGLHHKSLQERYDAEIVAIEAKFGQYCSEFWQPRQKRPAPGYNNSIESRLPADFDHGAEAARYRRAEAASYLTGQEWLRDAYRALAEHFERGGHIFYGFTAHGVAPGLYDGRSGKQVLKDAGVVEPGGIVSAKSAAARPRP